MAGSAPWADRTPDSRAASIPGTMKWYGWGAVDESFDPVGRPGVWPYAKRHLGIIEGQPVARPVALDQIALPPTRDNPLFFAALNDILTPEHWSRTPMDRLLHAYGKSTRDLWRMRHGLVDYAPDCVLFPDSEEQIAALLRAAHDNNVVVVPFGGGSNVAGCVEVYRPGSRVVAAVNLRRLNRVLEIDTVSGTARAQAGILGPALEEALNAAGLTLGHVPDSFPYSTLGGWVATRSSGMLSDGYGNIEDMVLSLRMATPTGFVSTRDVPHSSNGPDVKRLCIGSEGALGIITEVTLSVRKSPARREFRGYLFPSFAAGIEAMRACQRERAAPPLSRLNDPSRTQLSAAFRRKPSGLQAVVAYLFKSYLRRVRRFDLEKSCLLIAAFEGDAGSLAWSRRRTERIYRAHGGVGLGRSPGEAFAEGKFDFPHIRDFMMDHHVVADVAETSTVWRNILPLYEAGMKIYRDALGRGGRHRWVGCHVSHTYTAGASLYFSFAFRCATTDDRAEPAAELQHYLAAKQVGLEFFAANGATLSHHHAVGYEHLPWLMGENSVGDGTVVDAIKAKLDPRDIMNPGKLVSGFSREDLAAGPGAPPRQMPPSAVTR